MYRGEPGTTLDLVFEATTTLDAGGRLGFGMGVASAALGGWHFKELSAQTPTTGDTYGVQVRYFYDALGRLVERVVQPDGASPQTVYYYYDGDRLVEEVDGSGNVVASYVYGQYIDEVLQMQRNTDADPDLETYTYLHDDLFNVVGLAALNASGETYMVERYEYGDFGMPAFYDGAGTALMDNGQPAVQSLVENPFLFTGRRWEPHGQLYDYRTRFMDPQTGRFLRRDTIGLYGDPANMGNPYTYLGNNPWSGVDPWGNFGYYPGYAEDVRMSNEAIKAGWNKLSPKTRNRIKAGVGAVGATIEVIGGAAMAVGGSPTVVVSAAGVVMTAHGIDSLYANVRQACSGEETCTYTWNGVYAVTGSETAADVVDIGASMVDIPVALWRVGPKVYVKVGRWVGLLDNAGSLADEMVEGVVYAADDLGDEIAEELSEGLTKNSPRGNGGRGGGPDHAAIQEHITRTAGGTQEVPIPGSGRAVDNIDESGKYHQVGDMRSRGGYRPSARERGAIEDVREVVGPDVDIIYHDKLGEAPSLINPDLQPEWKPAPARHRKNP